MGFGFSLGHLLLSLLISVPATENVAEHFSHRVKYDEIPCLAPADYNRDNLKPYLSDISKTEWQDLKETLIDPEVFGKLFTPEIMQNCGSDILCQLTSALGIDIALKLIVIKHRFGFNASRYQKIDSKWKNSIQYSIQERLVFNHTQLNTILQTLFSLPPGFRSGESNKPLLKVHDLGQDTFANAVVSVSDLWARLPRKEQIYVLIHEFGHVADLSLPYSDQWRKISGWEVVSDLDQDRKRDWKSFPAKFSNACVSTYAQTNPNEDWAETMAAYRLAPDLLWKVSPEKYHWARYFGYQGIEYRDEKSCRNIQGFCRSPKLLEINPLELDHTAQDCSPYALLLSLGFSATETGATKCIFEKTLTKNFKEVAKDIPVREDLKPKLLEFCAQHADTQTLLLPKIDAAASAFLNRYRSVYQERLDKACKEQIPIVEGVCSQIRDANVTLRLQEPRSNELWTDLVWKNEKAINAYCRAYCEKTKLQITARN